MISLKYKQNSLYIHSIDKFDFKNYLLKKIDESDADKQGSVSVTDWSLENINGYFGIVEPFIKKTMDNIAHDIYKENSKHAEKIVQNCWFQKYLNGSDHFWHTHGFSHFANVIFIDLPDPTLKTDLFMIDYPDVKEGDILSFPAFCLHRSPSNFLNSQKTIISWNHVYRFSYRWDNN